MCNAAAHTIKNLALFCPCNFLAPLPLPWDGPHFESLQARREHCVLQSQLRAFRSISLTRKIFSPPGVQRKTSSVQFSGKPACSQSEKSLRTAKWILKKNTISLKLDTPLQMFGACLRSAHCTPAERVQKSWHPIALRNATADPGIVLIWKCHRNSAPDDRTWWRPASHLTKYVREGNNVLCRRYPVHAQAL